MYLDYYLQCLNHDNIPDYLLKYLLAPTLLRLKEVGYFCGMDYASKDIYNFTEYISRFDHSLTVALMAHMLTKNKYETLAGLFHDIATPCFSHVIDYMNKDYEKQESTEAYTAKILKDDTYLLKCLQEDHILPEDIIDFKKYSIIDNERPKLCADRLDGIILTGFGWTKNITKEDIKNILNNIAIYQNEYHENEIGFKNLAIAKQVLQVSDTINKYCHSKEDNYMMNLLSEITKLAINNNYISYEDLYRFNETSLLTILKDTNDKLLNAYLNEFFTIKKTAISEIPLPKIKARTIDPLVNGIRISKL